MGEKETATGEEFQQNPAQPVGRLAAGGADTDGIAIDEEGVQRQMGAGGFQPQQATTVKGSKSNSSERDAGPGMEDPGPLEASNLNLSKSNINRAAAGLGNDEAGTDGAGPEPQGATNLNSSRSNIYRDAGPGGEDPEPQEGSNLNSAKSN